MKLPFIIYVDLESLIENIDWCKNNKEKSSTTKVGEHISPRLFNFYRQGIFKNIENIWGHRK